MNTTDKDFPQTLYAAATSWVGTPFKPLHAAKGVGVDCANLTYAVLVEAGIALPDMGAPTFGKTADDRFMSVIEDFLGAYVSSGTLCGVDDVADPEIRSGDVLLFQVSRRVMHLTLAVSADEMVHVFGKSRPTAIVAIDARWRERLTKHYRVADNG